MFQKIEPLFPLQKLDLILNKLERERDTLPKTLLPLEKKFNDAQAELTQYKGKLKELKINTSKLELTLKETDQKIKQLTVKLNMVKKNEEYQAITRELSNLKEQKGQLEDEILNCYSKIELDEKIQTGLTERLNNIAGQLEESRQRVQRELKDKEQAIEELMQQRTKLTQDIDPEILRQYQRVLQAKEDKIVLAEVVENSCQGCMVGLTSQDINLLMQGKELIVCRNCSRILYIK
jgi:predicted  nucleic acid-binding Zn-ribbon protein